MSAFCSKYPKCGCKGIGTKCYDDFNITVTAGENLPQETKDALTELTKLAVEKTFIKIARKNIWDMLEKLQKGECMKADVMDVVDTYLEGNGKDFFCKNIGKNCQKPCHECDIYNGSLQGNSIDQEKDPIVFIQIKEVEEHQFNGLGHYFKPVKLSEINKHYGTNIL
jgi:hypothetical protein